MSGKDAVIQFSPKMRDPLDERQSVENMAELYDLNGKVGEAVRHDNLRVFVKDIQIAYYFVYGHSTDSRSDNANWVQERDYLNPAYIDVTYVEIQALIASNSLIVDQKYRLTDYAASYLEPGTTDLVTKPIEPIILTANGTDTLDHRAYSETNPDDEIYYDVTNNALDGGLTDGYFIPGKGGPGGTILITILTATTFKIDRNVKRDGSFTLDINDGTNSYSFNAGDLGIGFNYTDIGGGEYEIEILQPVDLTAPGLSFIIIGGNTTFGNRTGFVYRRKYLPNNLDFSFDFRAVTTKRYNLLANVWDVGTTYNDNDVVEFSGVLYLSVQNGNTGNAPGINSQYWLVLANNTGHLYSYEGLRTGSTVVAIDPADFIEVPVLYDESNGNILSVDNCFDIHIGSGGNEIPNIVFRKISTTSQYRNINIAGGSSEITVTFPSLDVTFNSVTDAVFSSLQNVYIERLFFGYFKASLVDSHFYGSMSYISWGGSLSRARGTNAFNVHIGESTDFFEFDSLTDVRITGNFNGNKFLYTSSDINVLGSYMSWNTIGSIANLTSIGNVVQYNNIGRFAQGNTFAGGMSRNTVGDFFRRNDFNGGLAGNKIGDDFSGQTSAVRNTFGGSVQNNIIGNDFGRGGRNIIGGTMADNVIGNNVKDINISGEFSNNTISGLFQANTYAQFTNNTVSGEFRINTGSGIVDSNEINGTVDNLNIDTITFNKIFGTVITMTGDTLNKCVIEAGTNDIVSGVSFGTMEKCSIKWLESATFDPAQTVQRNDFVSVAPGTNFTTATHCYGDYDVKYVKSVDAYALTYIDTLNVLTDVQTA